MQRLFFHSVVMALLGLLALSPSSSLALESPWVDEPQADVRLIAAHTATQASDDKAVLMGLEFRLDPEWKVYWRAPGDAGQPPVIDWSQSTNIKKVDFLWPVPHRFSVSGVDTFGYKDHVIYPLKVHPKQSNSAIQANGRVDYLICAELCIPRTVDLSLEVPGGPGEPSNKLERLQEAVALVPGYGAEKGLKLLDAGLHTSGDVPVIEVAALSDNGFIDPDLLIEGPEGYAYKKPEVIFSEDFTKVTLRSEVEQTWDSGEALTPSAINVTVTDYTSGIDSPLTAFQADPLPAAPQPEPLTLAGFAFILLAALLGGLILNLMPCVLPVLSLKMLSVVNKGGQDRSTVRLGFLATTAGIIVSFLAIAAGLIALKSAGTAIGWGIQFQQPLFLLGLTAVVLVFAANLFGWFEIPLPSSLAGLGGAGHGKGILGDFTKGVFATLLATPCSAPFLGTAVSFALTQNAGIIVLIFTLLGLGMALPYLLVAVFPGLASRLPQPGAWMTWVKVIMGVLLLATAAWLLSVLAAQIGLQAALIAGGLGLAMLVVLWLSRQRTALRLGTGVVAIIALLLLPGQFASVPATAQSLEAPWVAFDESQIAHHLSAGKTVFVDVTADWCVTCKVNKALVLKQEPVKSILASENVVAMVADWTRPDPTITAYLDRFGRSGIPFNVVYGPQARQGIPLPEFLTEGNVQAALSQATTTTALAQR